jgi:hypothetical protein
MSHSVATLGGFTNCTGQRYCLDMEQESVDRVSTLLQFRFAETGRVAATVDKPFEAVLF